MTVPREVEACVAAQYRAARDDAVLADRSELGRLLIEGSDALDLLHRLTTNDILSLRAGEGTAAAFVTGKGRLIDLVTFHRLQDRLLCLTGAGQSAAVAAHIERFTFREAVRVVDASRSLGTLGIYGARARAHAARLFGSAQADRPIHHPSEVELAGERAVLARWFPLGGEAYHLTAEAPVLPALRAAILKQSDGLVEARPECIEVLRIEAGLPVAGRELTEDYNPWEARLQDAISLTKGCYVGQEVIARLNTYRKVSKYLVRMLVVGGVPAPGARLERRDGDAIGTLTSASRVPGEDRVVALGYVRDEDAGEGREIAVVDGGRTLQATILGTAR
jgi:folate-binding protein YgfZ